MSDPRMPTAVLLHGFLGSPADWKPIVGRLAGQLSCATPLLEDHPTLDSLETDLRRSVPGPMVLIGYSMGARIALHLLLRDPHRFCAGVLACVSPGLETAAERAGRRQSDARLATRLRGLASSEALRRFLDDWYTQPIFAQVRSHPCYSAMLKRRLKIDPRKWAATLAHLGAGALPSLWKDLPRLRQPVLVLAGDLDDRYLKISAGMAARSAVIRTRLLPGSGHALLCENPSEFATQVATFLDEELRDT